MHNKSSKQKAKHTNTDTKNQYSDKNVKLNTVIGFQLPEDRRQKIPLLQRKHDY